eukprot:34107-Pelagomonas_calceolata.AAC.2
MDTCPALEGSQLLRGGASTALGRSLNSTWGMSYPEHKRSTNITPTSSAHAGSPQTQAAQTGSPQSIAHPSSPRTHAAYKQSVPEQPTNISSARSSSPQKQCTQLTHKHAAHLQQRLRICAAQPGGHDQVQAMLALEGTLCDRGQLVGDSAQVGQLADVLQLPHRYRGQELGESTSVVRASWQTVVDMHAYMGMNWLKRSSKFGYWALF